MLKKFPNQIFKVAKIVGITLHLNGNVHPEDIKEAFLQEEVI